MRDTHPVRLDPDGVDQRFQDVSPIVRIGQTVMDVPQWLGASHLSVHARPEMAEMYGLRAS